VNSTKALSVGCIGAGSIAQYTLREFAGCAGVTIAAIADPSHSRTQALADQFNIPTRLDNAAALCQIDSLDAVYVAVPNALHAPLATMALQAGKHVLLDKPFALSLAEAQNVVQLAQERQLTLMLGMNRRFDPAVQQARSLVAAGKLGEIYHAKAQWSRRSGIPKLGSWFTNQELAGGGALLDIGVHMLDATLYVLDCFDAQTVTGEVATRFGHRGLGEGGWGISEREHEQFDVDDFACAFIRLRNGQGHTVSLTLDASWAGHRHNSEQASIELLGDEAGLSVYDQTLYRNSDDGYHLVQKPNAAIEFAHRSRVHHFINVLRGQEALAIPPQQALAVQGILDAIYLSAKTRQEVNISHA